MNTLFQNVLTASFHGGVVIVVVALLRPLLRKTPKKFLCLLWMLAFLRLLMPFEIQSSMSLQPEIETVAQVRQEVLTQVEPEFVPGPEAAVEAEPVVQESGQTVVTPQTQPVQQTQAAEVQEQTESAKPKEKFDWTAAVPYAWLAVAGCFGIYTLVSYVNLKRKVRFSVKIPGGWECDNIETAFILGFIKPKIYIPMGMPKTVRKHILAHERTHLEKGDHWYKMIGFIALAIHWFNPLVWMAYILLCKDIELACDERVVQFMELEERKSYSAALLSCSTSRAHLAACPVAFGEVSVKERIRTVLHYRKPSFWISLVGVIAIGFVAVCLVTSPVGEETPKEEIIPEVTAETVTLPTEESVRKRIESAMEKLPKMDYYAISYAETTSKGSVMRDINFYRYGEESLWRSNVNGGRFGGLVMDGKNYVFSEDRWISTEATEEDILAMSNDESIPTPWLAALTMEFETAQSVLEEYLEQFSLEGKDLYNVKVVTQTNEYTGWTYETLQFTAQWEVEPGKLNTQPMEFYFDLEGNLTGAEISNVRLENADRVRFNVRTEMTEGEVLAEFETAARQSTNPEEFFLEKNQRPSNQTDFDFDYALGAGQMGWSFMNNQYFMKFGAVNTTATGTDIEFEYVADYGGSGVSGTVVTGDTFYIETLQDDLWVEYPLKGEAPVIPVQTVQSGMNHGFRLSFDWEDSYGELPYGFYRIGVFYTLTTTSGKTDTVLCYAKFRLYDENQDTLLAKCEAALAELFGGEPVHLIATDWNRVRMTAPAGVEPKYSTDEVWISGDDRLLECRSYLQDDGKLSHGSGLLRRDGTYYNIDWVEDSSRNAVEEWGTNTYADGGNFEIWSWDYEWFDSLVFEVVQEGNDIRVVQNENCYDDYSHTETTYSFGNDGKLKGLTYAFVRNDGEKVVEKEMEVLNTSASEIQAHIDAQDVTTPMTFSWQEDRDNAGSEGVKVGGFANTRARSDVDVVSVQELAQAEVPHYKDYPDMFSNTKNVYYDESAGMWKVVCGFSHDSCIFYDVYINDQGITQMMVTREEEPQW